jgi:membrane protein YdbS with pleckstrin-like domain
MSIYHGYRFEGLSVLVIWTAFLILVFIFDEPARRLLPWAFVILMGLVVGLCVAGEYVLYRIHARSTQRDD